jgi:hypothetical protein
MGSALQTPEHFRQRAFTFNQFHGQYVDVSDVG